MWFKNSSWVRSAAVVFNFVITSSAIHYFSPLLFFFIEIATFQKADNMLHLKEETHYVQK